MKLAHLFVLYLPFLSLLDEQLIRDALRLANLTMEKVGLYTDVDRRQFDRWLRGEGHMKHTALLKLPLSFWQWYALLQVEKYGLPKEVKRAAPLSLALLARKRMARASLMTRKQLAERKERVG